MATRTPKKVADQNPGQPQLLVPLEQLRARLDDQIGQGEALVGRGRGLLNGEAPLTEEAVKEFKHRYYSWDEFNTTLLRQSFDQEGPAREYTGLLIAVGGGPEPLPVQVSDACDSIGRSVRMLESLRDRLGLFRQHPSVTTEPTKSDLDQSANGDAFVVHGHDSGLKHEVARFLTKLLGREPVILQEQPDSGRTVIEKFEEHADKAGCAVVLFTGDDVAGRLVAT